MKLQELSPKINLFLKKARTNNMKNIPFANLVDKGLNFPPIPFNDSDGGINERRFDIFIDDKVFNSESYFSNTIN